jgi:ABC-type bacteriocin/lantibiotic exporter with double-glycine peptidase domain
VNPSARGLIDNVTVLTALVLTAAVDLAVPFVPQEKDTCGAAALAMVLGYWGRPVAHAEIAKALAEPELRGIRGTSLATFARERGLYALAYEGDMAQLRDYVGKGRPLIVAWKVGRDRFHDVVVVGFAEGAVVVHDPAEGAARRVAARVFEKRWAGASHWTLLVMPAP